MKGKSKAKKRKAQQTMTTLARFAMGFVVLTIILAIGASMTSNLQATQCSGKVGQFNYSSTICCSTVNVTNPTTACDVVGGYVSGVAFNVSQSGLDALNQFGTWFPVIVIAGIGAFVIGLIFTFFMGKGRSKGY